MPCAKDQKITYTLGEKNLQTSYPTKNSYVGYIRKFQNSPGIKQSINQPLAI